ncbi:PilN domain-containing protein [Vitiosangium sp. GDMCC 1.1324]|uniref:PilN domain-containing protein n=1 Tax=Vitiosangium sp. (strain GDMCC 1.1324) TaxID=2138576 RepID=UPI000D365482|nr:PilN domain-containing protein [Vitiosangium sp. GDMCC 1.1324]PTL78541.1 pilus assembly protein PilN [Vitiosangium sp. GDMCC 1.1324]
MMIRINLLPVRKKVQREMGRQILAFFAFVLVGAGVGNFFWYSDRDGVVQRQAAALDTTRRRIADLEKTIGEVNNINIRKAEVDKKLAVLDGLRKGRSGPVRMLDALATSLPKKAWLKAFNEERGSVKLTGSAVSHDDVAELMRNLNGIVWTPKGIGRLVEQRRDAKTSRVELVAAEAAVEEFPVGDIKAFFTNVDLKSTQQQAAKAASDVSTVDFEITLTANYSI